MTKTYPGTLIVFEGGDGSGKGTQARMLVQYLQTHGIAHDSLDFPQYDSFYGKIVAQFLRGEFGNIHEVSPYLASLTYALDRYAVKDRILSLLTMGKVVVTNRYVTSNIAHQGSKFKTNEERHAFITWIEQLEYGHHGLPHEDIVFYLKVPSAIAQELVKSKDSREYLHGKSHDIHEENLEYLSQTETWYDELSDRYPNWMKINCSENGIIRPKKAIHEDVICELKKRSIV